MYILLLEASLRKKYVKQSLIYILVYVSEGIMNLNLLVVFFSLLAFSCLSLQ